jgi:hypothetical protein
VTMKNNSITQIVKKNKRIENNVVYENADKEDHEMEEEEEQPDTANKARLLFTQVLPGFTRFFFFYSQRYGKSQFTVWVKVHFGYRVKPFVRSCTELYIGIKILQSSLFYCSSVMPEPMNSLPPCTTMFYCTKATYM